MRLLILFILMTLGQGEDSVEGLIQAYGFAKPQEKLKIIKQLDKLDSPRIQPFFGAQLKREKDHQVLEQLFWSWALLAENDAILEFMDAQSDKPVFRKYIPVLAKLKKLPRLDTLINLYKNSKLKRYRKELFEAIASLNNKKAFEFLRKTWKRNIDKAVALDLLPPLMGMKQSQDLEFFQLLMKSRFPFARVEGGRALLKENADYNQLTDILKKETHAQVRTELQGALARLKTKEAAVAILETIPSQFQGNLYQIVNLLNAMPPETVLAAAPEDWFYDREPLKFMTLVLTFSSPPYQPFLDKKMLKKIQYGTRDPLPGVRAASVAAFSRFPKNAVKAKLKLSTLVSAGGVETLWEVLDTIQNFRISDDVVVKKTLSLFKSKKWELRIRAAELAGALGLVQAMPHLEKCLTNNRLLVRIAGIKALGKIRCKESISLLLSRLPHEKGRGMWETIRSLNKVTGCNFGKDIKMWNNWWKSFKDKALPPALKVNLWSPVTAQKGKYAFYGLSLKNRHIVFVMDISGSMGGARLNKMINELTRIISGFTDDYRINMVFFESQVHKWKSDLVSMKKGKEDYKAQALKEVRELQTLGGTNIYDALKAAFDHEEAEAIMLLTDGRATVGPVHESKGILSAVKQWNRTKQMNIHTVAIGGADKAFMRKLAQITNGTYISY